jgi:hypothetical protein
MTIPQWIQKTQNAVISSVGTVFSHSLSFNGVPITPAGTWGETRIVLRSAGANSAAVILSLSDSVTVTIQSQGGNAVTADVICQLYWSAMA